MYSCVFRRNLSVLRRNHSSKRLYVNTSEDKFSPIYKFPYIRAASLINRMKAYQSALTLISVPSSIVLYNFNVISYDIVTNTCALGLTGTLSLFLFGTLSYKLIGFVYVDEDCTTLKISYVDFWGRRKNTKLAVKDVIPFTELPTTPTDLLYLTLRRFSSKDTFKINLKYGIVLDKNKFNNVFLQEI